MQHFVDEEASSLASLPTEVLVRIISLVPSVEDIGRLDCASQTFHAGSSSAPPPVEQALRERAAAAGHGLPAALPEGEASWTQMLCWDERRRRYGERAVAAGGMYHSLLIEGGGRLLTCGSETLDGGRPCAPPRRQTLAPRASAHLPTAPPPPTAHARAPLPRPPFFFAAACSAMGRLWSAS